MHELEDNYDSQVSREQYFTDCSGYESVEASDEGNDEVVDSRHSTRSDEKPPTLILPHGFTDLAENIFLAGMFKSRSHWTKLVQKYLNLPPEQHLQLVGDLQMLRFI